ncbi:hypothetical protein GQ53DRAFT_679802 [Thozetella sp. PMI_491]|nr:hypothetical protein GQ53DRAFT_679802 [Thozetella sp. PMI_491]
MPPRRRPAAFPMGGPASFREPPFSVPSFTSNKTLTVEPISVQAGARPTTHNMAHNHPQTRSSPTDLCPVYIDSQYWSFNALRPKEDVPAFLARDLDVSRLNVVYDILWWAGRQVASRPLHRVRMLGRKITIAEQADLHLVWSVECFFVKPLPDFLLDYSFWKEHLCRDNCPQDTYESARGFVLSYIWLIRHKSDFEIAKAEWLLPSELTWPMWREFVDSAVDHFGDLADPHSISKRYRYGELRLSRLDQIYRFAPRLRFQFLLRGYLYSYSTYGGFFKREFAWLIVAFAYISVILSGMQVGLTTVQLRDDDGFNKAAYGFTVAAIILPAVMFAGALLLYVCLWAFHVTVTVSSWWRRKKKEMLSSAYLPSMAQK